MGRPPKKNLPVELSKWLHLIGANIASLRDEHELTLAELSKKSKISITTINEIESRRFRDIRMSTLVALAEGLDVPVQTILRSFDVVKLRSSDQNRLLKASEDILRITKKMRDTE